MKDQIESIINEFNERKANDIRYFDIDDGDEPEEQRVGRADEVEELGRGHAV